MTPHEKRQFHEVSFTGTVSQTFLDINKSDKMRPDSGEVELHPNLRRIYPGA
jgi:hypothetical protein